MTRISGEEPVVWGPSIVGFGSMNYEYPSGRKGIMPVLGFSPQKAALTVYMEGFDDYLDFLDKLGKHKITTACLYINKLGDVDFDVLSQMIERPYKTISASATKPQTVEEYVAKIPDQTKEVFGRLRKIVMGALPQGAKEDISYGIIGYRAEGKRLKVYISGWKDHVALYPALKK